MGSLRANDELHHSDNDEGSTDALYERLKKLSTEHDLVLRTFRLLISDLCQNFNGGHPG